VLGAIAAKRQPGLTNQNYLGKGYLTRVLYLCTVALSRIEPEGESVLDLML
jgi:hypothetical protein